MNIFLTGATGFLGTTLVQELLAKGHNVTALVRAKEGISAIKRLIGSLPDHDVTYFRDHVADKTLHAIEGDVSRESFGLSENIYLKLAKHSDMIIHSAACTKLDTDWATYEKINIGGTREAIKFASVTQRRSLVQVSSAYVSGNRTGIVREDELDLTVGFRNRYEKSKATSEFEVRKASASGKIRSMILRPSIIIADSDTGRMNEDHHLFDFLFRLFWTRQMISKRGASKVTGADYTFNIIGNPDTTANFIPVDYVAKLISILIDTDGAWERVFHLTHPEPLTHKKLISYVEKSMDLLNMVFNPMEALRKLSPLEQRFFNAVKVYEKYFWQEAIFDQSQLKSVLDSDLPLPSPISQDSVNLIVDFVREKYTEREDSRKKIRAAL